MRNTLSTAAVAALTVFFLFAAMPAAAQEDELLKAPEVKEQIFTIKHASAHLVYNMVRGLITPYGNARFDAASSIIVVRDTEDSLAHIAEVIATMDVPPDNLRLTFFIFTAEKGVSSEPPAVLPDDVGLGLRELGKAMAYGNFKLLDSGMLTLSSTANRGELTLSGPNDANILISFAIDYNRQSRYAGLYELRVATRRGDIVRQLMRTDIGIEDGGVAVVGASKLDGGNQALVAIVTLAVSVVGQ